MIWGSFLIAAAGLKTPTRNGSNAHGGFTSDERKLKDALQLLMNRYG